MRHVSTEEPSEHRGAGSALASRPELPTRRVQVPPDARRTRLRLGAIGVSGGLFSGLLGVGGGVIMVPLLVFWAHLRQREAHAVSLGAIIPISAAGVLTYGAAGEVQLKEAAVLAVGAVAGAQIGARVLARADERTLKLAFGVFLIAVSGVLAVSR